MPHAEATQLLVAASTATGLVAALSLYPTLQNLKATRALKTGVLLLGAGLLVLSIHGVAKLTGSVLLADATRVVSALLVGIGFALATRGLLGPEQGGEHGTPPGGAAR